MRSVLDPDFCTALEYAITRAFHHSNRDELKGFWCDGVVLWAPSSELEIRRFEENGEIQGIAWLGKQEGEQYEITIRTSNGSKRAFRLGGDIKQYIPEAEADEWIYLHQKARRIIVRML